MSKLELCLSKAEEVLERNATSFGFKASFKYYNSIWARDGAITCLGATMIGSERLMAASKKTLETLATFQSETGQIPNVLVLDKSGSKIERVSWYATDATPWWIIGVWSYFRASQDDAFVKKLWPKLRKALLWLRYQQTDASLLITSPEAADWMDSSLARRGKVLYNNCLWFKAVECVNELSEVVGEKRLYDQDRIREMINAFFWPTEQSVSLVANSGFVWRTEWYGEAMYPSREHYLHFISFEWYDGRCDVLANILAIIFEIADADKKRKILNYIFEKELSNPYPIKVLNPPIWVSSYTWNPKIDLYRPKQVHNIPFHYHNAGIWPFVGGFYVLALARVGSKGRAMEELEKLAEANRVGKEVEWEFNEWLHGKTGEPMGATLQSWSASGYVIAYKAVKEGRIAL